MDYPQILITDSLKTNTRGNGHVVDLTDGARRLVTAHGLQEGHLLLFVPGATAALTTLEFEPGLVKDIPEFFDRIIPQDGVYHHNLTWHDGNGHSHVRAALLGPSITIPVAGGELLFGTWQQVVLVDFDVKSRERRVVAQLQGRGGKATR